MAKAKGGRMPLSRSAGYFRRYRFEVAFVERRMPYTTDEGEQQSYLSDAFGIIDLIAIRRGLVVGVQATSKTNHANHWTKLREEPRTVRWLNAGALLVLQSWQGDVEPGRLTRTWSHRTEIVLDGEPPPAVVDLATEIGADLRQLGDLQYRPPRPKRRRKGGQAETGWLFEERPPF